MKLITTMAELDKAILDLPPKLQRVLAAADPEGECQVCRSLSRSKAKTAEAIYDWHLDHFAARRVPVETARGAFKVGVPNHRDRAWVIYALAGWAEVPK